MKYKLVQIFFVILSIGCNNARDKKNDAAPIAVPALPPGGCLDCSDVNTQGCLALNCSPPNPTCDGANCPSTSSPPTTINSSALEKPLSDAGILKEVYDAAMKVDRKELAFAGAEGFGAHSQGGKGGKELIVSSLLDDPKKEGTLRWAVEQNYPRIIKFSVEGLIALSDNLRIISPFLTIDGSTAPGNGITIKDGTLLIEDTHDIIIRHIRIRPGDAVGKSMARGDASTRKKMPTDGISIKGAAHVIIDHCSVSWSYDEIASVTYSLYVTIQESLLAEALDNPELHGGESHAFGPLVGGFGVSYLKNVIAFYRIRGPQLTAGFDSDTTNVPTHLGRTAAINNVISSYEGSGTRVKIGIPKADFIVENNYYLNPLKTGAPYLEMVSEKDVDPNKASMESKVFLSGNMEQGKPLITNPWDNIKSYYTKEVHDKVKALTAPYELVPLKKLPTEQVKDYVLKSAGATLPKRDKIDTRIVKQISEGTGSVIHSQDDVGGY